MSVVVDCKCGRQFKVKEEYAGRKGHCPACGTQFTVPATPTQDRKPTAVAAQLLQPSRGLGDKAPTAGQRITKNSPRAAGNARQQPCPSCGKFISASASICEYCDAPLHERSKGPNTPSPAHAFRPTGGCDELSGFDWLISLLCPVLGVLLGIVRLARGNSVGAKMLGVSILAAAAYVGLCFMFLSAYGW
jgi:hypothetical protein